KSLAQVLHARITKAHREDEAADLTPKIASTDIPAGVSDQWAAYFGALNEAADHRRRELGTEVAAEPDGWAVEAFGPVPDDPTDRAEWEHRAGVVAAYREATGWDADDEAIGPAPGLSSTERRAAWFDAWQALGRPDTVPEEHSLSDGALRNRVRAWQ